LFSVCDGISPLLNVLREIIGSKPYSDDDLQVRICALILPGSRLTLLRIIVQILGADKTYDTIEDFKGLFPPLPKTPPRGDWSKYPGLVSDNYPLFNSPKAFATVVMLVGKTLEGKVGVIRELFEGLPNTSEEATDEQKQQVTEAMKDLETFVQTVVPGWTVPQSNRRTATQNNRRRAPYFMDPRASRTKKIRQNENSLPGRKINQKALMKKQICWKTQPGFLHLSTKP
jgi:hypothetical protein